MTFSDYTKTLCPDGTSITPEVSSSGHTSTPFPGHTSFPSLIIVFCLISLLSLPMTATAQQHLQPEYIPAEQVFQQIDLATSNGVISPDLAIQQKFYLIFEPEKLMDRFLPDQEVLIRCLTPLFHELDHNRNHLPPEIYRELDAYRQTTCQPPITDSVYTSPSGSFRIHYNTEGPDAVPDLEFVEQTAIAADSSWSHLSRRLGFANPVFGPHQPYEIYYQDFNYYGLTCEDGNSSFILLHHSFEDFPENDHPEGSQAGALKVTVAHEFKHASQYATNRWNEQSYSRSWMEMDATMIEEVIYPDVNDYFYYIKQDLRSMIPVNNSLFGSPHRPIPGSYNHVTWMLYFTEKLGIDFWVDVWDQLRHEVNKPILQAIRESLQQFEPGIPPDRVLEQHHLENLAWHLASGPDYSGRGFGFREREEYPNPRLFRSFSNLPDSTQRPESLDPLAGHFLQVEPFGSPSGSPRVSVSAEQPGIGVGVIGYFRTGEVEYLHQVAQATQVDIRADWSWDELQKLGVTVVNTNETLSNQYDFRVDSVYPDQITLFQNYPNPFDSSTRIGFSVHEEVDVRVEVYDVLGRRVRRLTDQSYEEGFHTIQFDANELASGVYIYRLSAGNERIARKMVLVK